MHLNDIPFGITDWKEIEPTDKEREAERLVIARRRALYARVLESADSARPATDRVDERDVEVRAARPCLRVGVARWRTRQFGAVRVRLVEYPPGYQSDHWCHKGHILFCVAGELETRLADGRSFRLTPGMSYQVADNAEPHRSRTAAGATLFVVD